MSHDVALGCLISTNLVLKDAQDFKEKSLGKAHRDIMDVQGMDIQRLPSFEVMIVTAT